jgi:hypothetical protein
MPAVQVQSSLGRGRGHRHFHGRNDRVSARGGGFLGGVVRTLSDDLARACRSRQASRGAPQGREGRRRRESRTRHQVWRAVDPVARRDPGWARGRPSRRRASSRCARTSIASSACHLIVESASTFRERGVSPGAEPLEPRSTRSATRLRGLQRIRADSRSSTCERWRASGASAAGSTPCHSGSDTSMHAAEHGVSIRELDKAL